MQKFIGIDEAGYGPLLGPLAVVGIGSTHPSATLTACWQEARVPVMDSKKLHKTDHLAPLEAVALGVVTWATGFTPGSAAELFALLGEQPQDIADVPWCVESAQLVLPLAGEPIVLPNLGKQGGMWGGLLHPWQLNDAQSKGLNRSQAEWEVISKIIQQQQQVRQLHLSCDRLGGRKCYGDLLENCYAGWQCDIVEEVSARCAYTLTNPSSQQHAFEFLVKGEQRNILIAAASCVAKYARELHMHLLNQWWKRELRWLKPTAGYPQDAKRWLHQIGSGHRNAWGYQLQRGWREEDQK